MIRAIDKGYFPALPKLNNRRSLVHVENVIAAAVLAASKPIANKKCYFVTDDAPLSTRELFESICHVLGKQIPRWYIPESVLKTLGLAGDLVGRVRRTRCTFDSDAVEKLVESAWYSSERIQRDLQYFPEMSFEQSLPELIRWSREENR